MLADQVPAGNTVHTCLKCALPRWPAVGRPSGNENLTPLENHITILPMRGQSGDPLASPGSTVSPTALFGDCPMSVASAPRPQTSQKQDLVCLALSLSTWSKSRRMWSVRCARNIHGASTRHQALRQRLPVSNLIPSSQPHWMQLRSVHPFYR